VLAFFTLSQCFERTARRFDTKPSSPILAGNRKQIWADLSALQATFFAAV
jgi:hypothetical protein